MLKNGIDVQTSNGFLILLIRHYLCGLLVDVITGMKTVDKALLDAYNDATSVINYY